MTLVTRIRFGALAHGAPDAPPLRSELALPGMRIGLYGGSFNPVHDGHIHVASEAMRRLALDRVWWLVTPQNPLKSPAETADYARRLAAVRQAIADRPGFVASDVEARLGAAFTIETVKALAARHPRVRFVWIMGADSLRQLHRWRDWTGILARLPVAVVARPDDALRARLSPAARRFAWARIDPGQAAALPDLAPPAWTYLTAPLNPASSTALRERADRGADPAKPPEPATVTLDGAEGRSVVGFFRRFVQRKGRSAD